MKRHITKITPVKWFSSPPEAVWAGLMDTWLTASQWLDLYRRGITPMIWTQVGPERRWYRGCPPRPWVVPNNLAYLASTRKARRLP